MEVASTQQNPDLIDLSVLDAGERASAWSRAVLSCFPGMSVRRVDHRPATGIIAHVAMGGGSLWSVRSPEVTVGFAPSRHRDSQVSLLMQRAGRTIVTQQLRRCELQPGDMCILDEQLPFTMEGKDDGQFVFLRMPRLPVLTRNPQLENQTAISLLAVDPAVSLVGETLAATLRSAPFMRESQRCANLVAMIDLLGVIDTRVENGAGSTLWRVQAALSFIELNFTRHGLSAEDVARAQRISRRRLDQLLRETTGHTITGHIWKRRLDQSAADLLDPLRAKSTASQIAFANGFEDAAHFTRAFKRSHGHSPLQWRNLRQQAQ